MILLVLEVKEEMTKIYFHVVQWLWYLSNLIVLYEALRSSSSVLAPPYGRPHYSLFPCLNVGLFHTTWHQQFQIVIQHNVNGI